MSETTRAGDNWFHWRGGTSEKSRASAKLARRIGRRLRCIHIVVLRSALGILAGYLVFGLSAALLFALSGQDPSMLPTPEFLVFSILYGMVFAFAGGYLAGLIAGRRSRLHAALVAITLAGVALFSLVMDFGETSPWSQLAAISLMAPAALLGGLLREKHTLPPEFL
jgi:MFS family permease